jgi:hypothetical protein
MPTLTDEVRAAHEAGHLAHVATLNKDGSPHVTIAAQPGQGRGDAR